MKRRCRLAVTLVTLAMHLLAPVATYAAARPAVAWSDYCSTAARSAVPSGGVVHANSGVPAPRPSHSAHAHCPSCLGASAALATPPSATPFVVRPRSLERAASGQAHTDIAARLELLPPLRGPPSLFL